MRNRLRPNGQQPPLQPAADIAADEEATRPLKPETASLSPAHEVMCNACMCVIYGPVYECTKCIEFRMCFKCFRRVVKMHFRGHPFRKITCSGEKLEIDPWV
ncbi:hypothetical protein J3459_003822 [Metarhizium acridum]|nr:hypothetical protein J3459_003850 [Metarhizium acridum]KAG8428543.1 hypothetical protein J3459_003822 [Metarhizium acridum]